MRSRLSTLACVVVLVAATLALAAGRPIASLGHETAEATAGMTVSSSPGLVDSIRRHPSASKVALKSGAVGDRAHHHNESQSSPTTADERPDRVMLLDGSDRWRSLLLGAPPLLP